MGNHFAVLSRKMTQTYLTSKRILLAVVWKIDPREPEMKLGDLLEVLQQSKEKTMVVGRTRSKNESGKKWSDRDFPGGPVVKTS